MTPYRIPYPSLENYPEPMERAGLLSCLLFALLFTCLLCMIAPLRLLEKP